MIFDMPHLMRILKQIMYIALTILAIYISYKLAIFFMPFLIALIIAFLMEPAIKFLMNKFELTRRTSSIIMFIIVFGLIVGILAWGITTISSEATGLLKMLNVYFDKAYSQTQDIGTLLSFDGIQISDELKNAINDSAKDTLNSISNWLQSFLTGVGGIITKAPTIAIYLVVTILALYFICTDKIYILDQAEHHLPRKWSKEIFIHTKEISSTLISYLKAEGILILVSFVISLVGLYIYKFIGFNVEYPLLIALAICFVDALPILGSGTVMVPWAIFVSLEGDIKFGVAILMLWIVMSVVRQFLEPKIISNQIGIHPIFTLIAMYTGFKIIGVFGLIVGPIALIILKNIFSNLIDKGILKTIFDKK